VSGTEAGRRSGTRTKFARGTGEATAVAGVTVTFLGGQSMFLAKLGACDAVSSF
jgi:hypothetical protein